MAKRSFKLWFFLALLLAIGGGIGAALVAVGWINDDPRTGPVSNASLDVDGLAGDDELPNRSPDDRFRDMLSEAKTKAERIDAIRRLADQPWAHSQIVGIRAIVLRDEDGDTRVAAFECILKLCRRESLSARDDFLVESLRNPHAEVRHAAIQASEGNDSQQVVTGLLEYSSSGAKDSFVALPVLARSLLPEAQAEVLRVAKDATVPRGERLRAIFLLSLHDTPENRNYLADLMAGDDKELAKVALEAVDAMNEGK